MRRLAAAILLALALSAATLGTALGHVHGITPLGCLTQDNANSGGNGTEDGAADSENGGPLFGVIPISVGNAPLSSNVGDGGQHSALWPCT